MLSMIFIKQLLLRVSIRLANLSFSIEARQSVLQLLIDHHTLIILWDAPADVNLLELRPVFDRITTTGPNTIFQITWFGIIRSVGIVFKSLIAKISSFSLDLIHSLRQAILVMT